VVFLGRDDRGANLIEWGILVSLIAIIAILAVTFVGDETSTMFSNIGNGFTP
jgi:Flp pilus assembly pilin Flp